MNPDVIESPALSPISELDIEPKDFIIDFLKDELKKFMEIQVQNQLTIQSLHNQNTNLIRENGEKESLSCSWMGRVEILTEEKKVLTQKILELKAEVKRKDDLIQDSLKLVNHYFGDLLRGTGKPPTALDRIHLYK